MLVIAHPVSDQAKSDALSILKDSKDTKLKIVVDATHSGVLTNKRVYPARKVMAGYKSFFSKANGGTSEFDKPVITHHNDSNDAIGRVNFAVFTALKKDQDFEQDYLNPDPMGSRGSGVVTVTANISDPEAIQKIVDGRYLSVSAGHSTDAMFCSICTNSIYSDECMHTPGMYYDASGEKTDPEHGSLCYAITNNMDYHEISFVNMPAQPPAKLLEFNWESGKDSLINDGCITSVTSAKKEIVKAYSLVDNDREFSLLTGSDKSTKQKIYIIATSTADKLRTKLTEETVAKKDELNESRSSSSDVNSNADSSGAISENNSEEIEETKNTDTQISEEENKTMDEEIKKLNDEISALKLSLATAEEKVKTLQAAVTAKDSEMVAVNKSMVDLKKDMAEHLATALASYKIRLGKPDVKGLKTDAEKKTYIDGLSKRSIESLKDSISDLLLETEVEEKIVKNTTSSAADHIEGSKVEPNVLATNNTARKTVVAEKKDTLSDLD